MKTSYHFHYDRLPIQIATEFDYLGVRFGASGCFNVAASTALSKSSFASFKVRSLHSKTGFVSTNSRNLLHQSFVRSTLVYGSEVWGLL